ncbi:hypothetical protein [Arcobacter aquimarinus]|uniref:hypothetical protein n=1 Tax=Arcobacter aquimarinus TaxID=1315211 RepID=UPI003BAEA9E8
MNTISKENKEELDNLINKYILEFKVDKYNFDNFKSAINKLIEKENVYIENIESKELDYLKISYIFHIINSAKIAISELKKVSKDERRIAYYENNKNSTLDNLVDEYTQMLKEQGYKKLSLLASKKEIKFKRLLAKMKRDKSLFFNFYLLIFSLNDIDKLAKKEKDKNLIELLLNLFEFYRVGHATEQQIYKSVAIQIFSIYENEFEKKELQEDIISPIITSCFNLDKNYSNFNNIGMQEVYIKNLIYSFPLFECNSKLQKEQKKEIFRFFISSKDLFPKFFPKFLRKKIAYYYFQNLLEYYYKMDTLNFFGFAPKKK